MQCLEPVESAGSVYLRVITNPADISSCSYVTLTGSEYLILSDVAQQASAPYEYADGAAAFSAMFVATITLYLVIRNMTEILRIVRAGLSGLISR